ncbi:uncharacterized protein [Rutidosis leptorrhynchoides]|uniref:uncharacterized protein isoform X2 n=1 Tax=Rutidosis leptorrhynchoides TaxID=125765 RepID=UPI003A99536D
MKYKRGSIVEVLTTGEVPYHSWRRAQIVSGKRHGYTVRYDLYSGSANQEIVEHVSTKFIRPCPPLVKILECMPGDVVEVFHELSWKMAVVSKAFSCDLFLVRLVGSFIEFEASKSELRVRQSWQNDEWVVIGKVHKNNINGRCNKLLKRNLDSDSYQKQMVAKGDSYIKSLQFGVQNDNLQESHIVSARTLKRGSPYYCSQDEVNEGSAQKLRITQKEGRRLRVLIESPDKVDAVPNFKKLPSEECLHTADMERKDLSGTYRKVYDYDDDSVVCSVGSCSSNSYSRDDIEENGSHDSDAESVCQGGHEDIALYNKEVAAEIHRLELQAYRYTIQALHASGPLTWEKETMAQSWSLVHLAYESVS